MPGIFLSKLNQHGRSARPGARPLRLPIVQPGLALLDLTGEGEDRLLDEFNQALEHLRLAGKVAVQRRFADLQPRRQRGRGDALATGLFQHGGQRLQDLHASFARGLGRLRTGHGRGGFAGGGIGAVHGSSDIMKLFSHRPGQGLP